MLLGFFLKLFFSKHYQFYFYFCKEQLKVLLFLFFFLWKEDTNRKRKISVLNNEYTSDVFEQKKRFTAFRSANFLMSQQYITDIREISVDL